MVSLTKKNQTISNNRKESHYRLKSSVIAAQNENDSVCDPKHCVAPPAPGDTELDEIFKLEAGLIRLPVMTPVTDPYVLEEAILFARSEQIHEVAEDLGLFSEEEKSSVDSHTIAPGSNRKKLADTGTT